MLFLEKEIKDIIAQKEINLVELDNDTSKLLRSKIITKFFHDSETTQLWNQFISNEEFSVREEDAWKWLDEFLFSIESYFFFDEPEDDIIYKIEPNHSKVSFLQEIILYTFYITNPNLDFLIYFNDSNYLSAIGTAEPWLRNKAIELSKTGWKDMDGFYWDENGVKKR